MWFNQYIVVFLAVFTFNTIVKVSADSTAKKCLLCDSSRQESCIQNPSTGSTCESKGGYCYVHISDEGIVRRGCVDESDNKVSRPDYCDDKKETCVVCSDRENCNEKKFTLERCFEAKYDIKTPIEQKDSLSKQCPVTMEPMGCYHMERNKKVEKGCVSDLNKQKQDEYKLSKDCEFCSNPNCNHKVVRQLECFHCINGTDVNCAEPSELEELIDYSNTSSSCLVGIDEDGYTHRLGSSIDQTIDTKQFPKGLEVCYNSSCNNFVFPKNRFKCVQCQGESDCNLNSQKAKQKITPKVCEIYSKKEHCFTYSDDDGKIHRGCMSDATKTRQSCEKNDERCTQCDESGCNNEPRSAGNSHFKIQNQPLIGLLLISSGFKIFFNYL